MITNFIISVTSWHLGFKCAYILAETYVQQYYEVYAYVNICIWELKSGKYLQFSRIRLHDLDQESLVRRQ